MNELKIGDPAPEFSLPDQDGKTLGLKDYRGRKVVVYFYPKDSTPGCTKEACSFRDHHQELQDRGVAVLGISPDSPKSHQGFREKQALPFPLLSDPDLVAIKAFGAWGTKSMYGKEYEGLLRWTFLVGEDGKILNIWKKVNTGTHGQDILSYIESC